MDEGGGKEGRKEGRANQVWWGISVISATQEAQLGGYHSP
jgi:hypothetical protein